ncbi:MAG: hypothetical protein PHY92_07755 [Alphaproteobacteria bacterium]|nr:hypothetical protein [Alphaproteobacteria bacterium]
MDERDLQLAQSAVLLDRQYLLIERIVATQNHVLKNFELAIENKEQNLIHVLDVYNYVFALIDHLERYRKIALSFPKFNKRSLEYKSLMSSTGELRGVRNQLQHINNDIVNDYTGPLLGIVCWASDLKQFIAAFHDIGRQRSSPGLIFDTATGKYTQEFCYIYNEKYYDLKKAIMGVEVFNRYIKTKIKIQIGGKDYNASEHFAALCVGFKL